MKKEQIQQLFEQFGNSCYDFKGIEYWSARDLQVIFGYTEWRNFLKVIEKAKEACINSGGKVIDHFVDINKMIALAKGVQRKINEMALSRYACYLVAQNGDASKSPVAFAQTYFEVQTRKQEIIEQRFLDIARVSAREKLSRSEKALSDILHERGVDDNGFAIIKSKDDQALFGGFTTNDMKQKLQIPDSRSLADFSPTLFIKAKVFAAELTSNKVTEKDLPLTTSTKRDIKTT